MVPVVPRKPNAKKVAEAQAGLLAFLQSAGVEVEEEQIATALNADEQRYVPREHQDFSRLQSEGVLLYLENRAIGFMAKICKECKQAFSTRYKNVAYCSSLCAGTAMQKKMGIRWDYSRDSYEMMDVERPLIVGPQAYQVLLEMAQRILDNHNILVQEHLETPSPDASELLEDDEEQHPNLQEDDTNLEVSPPELNLPSSSDDLLGFGPSPF